MEVFHMKNKLVAIAAATLLASPMAFAGDMPKASVGGFYSMVDANGTDGDGFGVRGWAGLGPMWFVHGEYAMLGLDDNGGDVDELRIGGGVHGKIATKGFWLAKGEYIDVSFDDDAASSDGFGIHGGAGFMPTDAFSLYGTLGYLMFSADAADHSGNEINLGAKMNFSKNWSGQFDYRTYMGTFDAPGDPDFDFDEIRLGANYSFY
jgi:opacity protein-like surface antigen